MAHGLNSVVIRRGVAASVGCRNEGGKGVGSRRIFAPHFKLQVLDSYRNDADCKGNQRATARKYGIHRRQIQKWLQVENTLRNTVKEKLKQEVATATTTAAAVVVITTTTTTTTTTIMTTTAAVAATAEPTPDDNKRTSPSSSCNSRVLDLTLSNGGRQRDGVRSASAAEAAALARRSPAVVPPYVGPPSPPLDFTSPRHGGSPTVAEGLPLAAPIDLSLKRPTSAADLAAGAPASPSTPPQRRPVYRHLPPSLPLDTSPEPQPDDAWDLSTKRKCPTDDDSYDRPTTTADFTPMRSSSKFDPIQPDTSPKPVKLFKPYLDDIKKSPPPTPPLALLQPMDVCCPIICEPYFYNNNNNNNSNSPVCDSTGSYTLHELQPNHYYYNPPYPLVEYDVKGAYCYEEIGYGHHGLAPLKQRQSYSLDFKLSAIDCYYQDSICKGNQRAVANKYNVHRRQIQKWLKQAEELRLRNESMKQLHAVR